MTIRGGGSFGAAATARDATALRALSGQARRLSLPPSSLDAAGLESCSPRRPRRSPGPAALARGRHLTDFWIHFELGRVLLQGKDKSPVILEEAIGCYRTALALRPAASAAHINLGTCLHAQNQLDEAIVAYPQGHRARPQERAGPRRGKPRRSAVPQARNPTLDEAHTSRRIPQGHRGSTPRTSAVPATTTSASLCSQEPVGRGHRRIRKAIDTRPQARQRPTTTSATRC